MISFEDYDEDDTDQLTNVDHSIRQVLKDLKEQFYSISNLNSPEARREKGKLRLRMKQINKYLNDSYDIVKNEL